jgi:hypothetical protein
VVGSLLDLPTIKALRVISVVGQVESECATEQFPELFTDLGRLMDNYETRLESDAITYALTTPRRVPLPLLPKVEAELQCMVDLGVVSKIDMPTEWCASMVVVPKQNGAVRIMIVDLTKLNKSVRREHLIIPSVDYPCTDRRSKVFLQVGCKFRLLASRASSRVSQIDHLHHPFGRFWNRAPPRLGWNHWYR